MDIACAWGTISIPRAFYSNLSYISEMKLGSKFSQAHLYNYNIKASINQGNLTTL